MDIAEMRQSIDELRELTTESPFHIGEKILIRTVTYHLTGEITAIIGKFLVLKDAAWIASDGRFTPAINEGILDEVEPVNGLVRVNTEAFIDVYEWRHALPREQK